ncbi:hypothetical protein MRX96_001259 [Rhipicephalus microplus]
MFRNRNAQIAEFQKKFGGVCEAIQRQLLNIKIATVPKTSSTGPPTCTSQTKNPIKEPTYPGTSQPRQPQLRKFRLLRPTQPDVKPRLPPVIAMNQAGNNFRKQESRQPGPHFSEGAGSKKQVVAPFLNPKTKETSLPERKKLVGAPDCNVESAESCLAIHKEQMAALVRNLKPVQTDSVKQGAALVRKRESMQHSLLKPRLPPVVAMNQAGNDFRK